MSSGLLATAVAAMVGMSFAVGDEKRRKDDEDEGGDEEDG